MDAPSPRRSPAPEEPLSLALMNTLRAGRSPGDRLAGIDGTRKWLEEVGLTGPRYPASEPVRSALVEARTALRAHAADPSSARACAALDTVLAWGEARPSVTPDGWTVRARLDDPAHFAGWSAAVDYLDLLRRDAGRIRKCAHPDCILYFYDTSPKANRRWCSMAGCGNRAKAARHYARARGRS